MAKLPLRWKIVVAVGVAIVSFVAVSLYLGRGSAANADVGDCLQETGSNALERIDCDSPDARYEVVGKVEDKSQAEATFGTCGAFKEATDIHWEEAGGGVVLCLAAASK